MNDYSKEVEEAREMSRRIKERTELIFKELEDHKGRNEKC